MREVTKTFKVYTFSSATNEIKDKIRDNFRNDGWLYEHNLQERIKTLEEFAKYIDVSLDYSISCVPDCGEYIRITPFYSFNNTYEALKDLLKETQDCPLTGVCYDHDLLDVIKKHGVSDEGLRLAFTDYIDSIHKEYEHMLTDEYLQDLCEANGYEFLENGKMY